MNCLKPIVKFNDFTLCRDYEYNKTFVSWKHFNNKSQLDGWVNKNKVQIIPCGNCDSCYSFKRFNWVERLKHESHYWKNIYFITLTYNNENCPYELNKKHVQNFVKYLRRYIKLEDDKYNLKYFATGEYGSKSMRPHYHLCLFTNYDLDLKPLNKKLYVCSLISKCWKNKGFISVGFDTRGESFGYTFNYSTKSLTRSYLNLQWKKYYKERDNLVSSNGKGYLTYLKIDQLYRSYGFKNPEFIIMSKTLGYKGVDYLENQTKAELINNSSRVNSLKINPISYPMFYDFNDELGELIKNKKMMCKTRSITVTSKTKEELFTWLNVYNNQRVKRVHLFNQLKYLGLAAKIDYNNNIKLKENKKLKGNI